MTRGATGGGEKMGDPFCVLRGPSAFSENKLRRARPFCAARPWFTGRQLPALALGGDALFDRG